MRDLASQHGISMPCYANVTGDGTPERVVGEGSFSTNAVYIFRNADVLRNPGQAGEGYLVGDTRETNCDVTAMTVTPATVAADAGDAGQ